MKMLDYLIATHSAITMIPPPMPPLETERPRTPPPPSHRNTPKKKKEKEKLIAQECKTIPIVNGRLTIICGHIFPSCILNAPSVIVDTFSRSIFTLTSHSFAGGECFSTTTVYMHRVKIVGNIKDEVVLIYRRVTSPL